MSSVTERNGTIVNGDGLRRSAFSARIATVHLGKSDVADATAVITEVQQDNGDGTIGLGLLRRFDFILDLGANKLWLAPISSFRLSK